MNWRERILLGAVVGALGIVTRTGAAVALLLFYDIPDQGLIFYGVTAWLILGIASVLFAWLADRFPEGRHIPLHLAFCAAASVALSALSQIIQYIRWPMPVWHQFGGLAVINLPTHIFLYAIVMGLAWAVRFHRGVAAQARERIRIDADIAARTGEALKRQLQPELIIGILDRIAALAHENAIAAERLLLRLARHVRLLLRACTEESWTAADEQRLAGSAAALGEKIGIAVPETRVDREAVAAPITGAAVTQQACRLLSPAVVAGGVVLLFFVFDVYVQTPRRVGEPEAVATVRDFSILLWIVVAPLLALAVGGLASLRFRYAITGVVLLTYLAAAFVVGTSLLLYRDLFRIPLAATAVAPVLGLRNVMIGAGLAALTFAVTWSRRFIRARLANARLANEITIAEAQALEARLHPHFLFNALNSIATLLRERPDAAKEMTERLAAFLRFAVRTAGRQEWTLEEERTAIDDYLFIQQVRLGERLRTRWQVAPRAAGATLPRLLLQPLVENAVKHGASRLEDGSSVVVSIARERQRLLVKVENDIPQTPEARVAFGRGLRYVASRLVSLYGSEGRLEVGRAAHRFTVSCRFPYQPKEVV